MSMYEMAVKIVGEVPAPYEFIYIIFTILLVFVALYVLCFPIIFLYGIMGNK